MQVFNGSRSTRTEEEVIANSVLQQEWRRLQGDQGAEGAAVQPSESSKPIEGDCPICYDSLEPGGTTAQVRCMLSLERPPSCGPSCREDCSALQQLPSP